MRKPFKSITKKMIFVFCLFLGILMLGIAFMNIMFYKCFKIWKIEKQMIVQGDTIAQHFKDIEITKKSVKEYEAEIFQATESYNLSIRIATDQYQILIDSSSYHSTGKMKLSNQTIDMIEKNSEKINKNSYCIIRSYREESDNPYILYVRKLDQNYYLTISRTMRSIDEDIRTSNVFLLISGSIVAVLGILITYFFSRSFTKPILQIKQISQKISCLDFSAKVEVKSEDELGELARSVNLISDRLSESIHLLKSDIDRRNQLVRDMSHELKTPITAIKGYTEALKYGIAKNPMQTNQYYDIIIQECDRMNLLIHELIELSKLDTLEDTMNIEAFDLEPILTDLYEQYKYEMEKKNVKYEIQLQDRIILGDCHILMRAIKNLVENAVRYVNDNGTIRLTGLTQRNQYIFKVYNSGSRVPEESLSAVWDVFYKVDESRKHEEDTYGIGLAIVKSAVKLHRGQVEVENLVDGVEFRLILPQPKNSDYSLAN